VTWLGRRAVLAGRFVSSGSRTSHGACSRELPAEDVRGVVYVPLFEGLLIERSSASRWAPRRCGESLTVWASSGELVFLLQWVVMRRGLRVFVRGADPSLVSSPTPDLGG
jgi:hypothetical protein